MEYLSKGDVIVKGKLEIIDEDRLCYMVSIIVRGKKSLRTISKHLLQEYIDYFNNSSSKNSKEARDELTGKTDVDRFEYGYTATLTDIAKYAIQNKKFINNGNTPQLQQEGFPRQIIYYGAPGTGKSFKVKELTEGKNVVRTTFHPDSDYSTFVGAYKPTMKPQSNGTEQIVYSFVPQAFLKAYMMAWKDLSKPCYLIIEEINRGNCAQIFGDIFQLLDREDDGFSSYPIEADKDIQQYLAETFANFDDKQKQVIHNQAIIDGTKMQLPPNFHILATMNTSDQSLFPIDSAFKRRWEWKYVPISQGVNNNKEPLNWKIRVDNNLYDWWDFLQKINVKIDTLTSSEDKKLGYFFCKAKDGIIDEETFVEKVIFYLWNDVFKDYVFDDTLFADTEADADKSGEDTSPEKQEAKKSNRLTFDKFYNEDGTVNKGKVKMFLDEKHLNVLAKSALDQTNDNFQTTDNDTASGRNRDKYFIEINGDRDDNKGKGYGKAEVVREAIRKYSKIHEKDSAQEIVDAWHKIGITNPKPFIETYNFQKSGDSKTRSIGILLANGNEVYVSSEWGEDSNTRPGNIGPFIKAVNSQNWGIHIEKIEKS